MSCTVKWAPPSSFVRSVLRTTKMSRSNPVVTLCALPVLRPGRYCNEPYCKNSFQEQNFDRMGVDVQGKLGVMAESSCPSVQYSVRFYRKKPVRSENS